MALLLLLGSIELRYVYQLSQLGSVGAALCGGGAAATVELRLLGDGTSLEFFALDGLANMAAFVSPLSDALAETGSVRVEASGAGCVEAAGAAHRMATIWE